MAFSTAVSVAAFSVVLTETFAAVAASTLVPAAFLSGARALKRAAENDNDDGAAMTTALGSLTNSAPGVAEAMNAVTTGISAIDEIDLLVPKTAKIHAEFEFDASERYQTELGVGALVKVVSVNAGYSQLYETSTRNRITLDIDFAAVSYTLA